METHTLLAIKGQQCADRGFEPVGGLWDDLQILKIWLGRQDARKQVRKERMSLTPVIKMGILLERPTASRQVLATWTC